MDEGKAKRRPKLCVKVEEDPAPGNNAFDLTSFRDGLESVQVRDVSKELLPADLEYLGVLGVGSQGTVDKVLHKPSGRLLARKTIRVDMSPSEAARKKREDLFLEVKTYAQSACPYLVRSFGSHFTDGLIVTVLEYMDCGSLADVLQVAGPMPERAVATLASQLARALDYLHTIRHTVHRDLKPANILLNSDGITKITDFGVSKEVITQVGCMTFVGTLAYMSPERIDSSRTVNNSYNYAADVYALGLILVESALGHYPYPAEVMKRTFEYMQLVIAGTPPLTSWLPVDAFSEDFRSFVGACMRAEPQERPRAAALLEHPFLVGADAFDFAGWLRDHVIFAARPAGTGATATTPPAAVATTVASSGNAAAAAPSPAAAAVVAT